MPVKAEDEPSQAVWLVMAFRSVEQRLAARLVELVERFGLLWRGAARRVR